MPEQQPSQQNNDSIKKPICAARPSDRESRTGRYGERGSAGSNKADRLFHRIAPGGERKVLMHSCCAPCVGPLMESLQDEGYELAIYFYNPNIHPQREYEIRKQENIRYAEKLNIPFIDADYDTTRWFDITRGHEKDPERGERCSMCFDMRFVKTAEYASKNGYKVITSSLGISRWKDFEQVTNAGTHAASLFPGVTYWERNWRKGGGAQRMIDLAKEENFYQQQYCGCVYSLREKNQWRTANERPKVEFGKDFYTFGSDENSSPRDSGAQAPQSGNQV